MKTFLLKIIIFISSIFGIPQNITTKPINILAPQNISTSTQPKPISKTTITKKIVPVNTKPSKQTTQIIPTVLIKQPELQIPFETLNIQTRKALVNILCTTQSSGPLSPITGSGVIISSNGVILTNAHVGQYFLLKDFNDQKNFVQCIIRTGNPAYPTYTAELVYISPTWINQNKTLLIETDPKGTGEHDYAFLHITGKIDKSEMPTTLPYLPINISENNAVGSSTLLASYPAGFLGGQSIIQDLFQSSAITTISEVFTFNKDTVDLISVPGTVLSQKGSSGGPVVNSNGELIGLISTATENTQTSARDLRAITLSYINRDLTTESGQSIADIILHPSEYAQSFNANISPKLTEILTNAILKK